MSVKVSDLKGDGNAWVIIYRGNKRKQRKVGDWDKARKLAEEIEAEEARRLVGLPEPLPLKEVLEQHRLTHVDTLKHGTKLLQTGQIANHLVPAFGELDARELTEAHVLNFVEGMLEKYSPSFTRSCVNVLRKAMKRLRRDHPDVPELLLEIAEIFGRAENSRAEEIRAVDSWTHDEAEKLLAIVRKHEPRYYPIVLTLLHTGCRRGEAIGMRWGDVDFRRKRIAIRRARTNARTVLPKHRKRWDPPRFVRITPPMEGALRGLRTFRYKKSGGWVFATKNGTPIQETTVYRAWQRIKELAAEHEVRPLTMHSLRHTFATLSLASGKSVKWVSQQLGHRDAAMTLNVYAHALPDEEEDLSYLPGSGAGADRRWAGASRTRGSGGNLPSA